MTRDERLTRGQQRLRMTNFWERLGTDDGGLPIHLPIGLTADGEGPTSDADAHHFACWCGDKQCPLSVAFAVADARVRANERDRKAALLAGALALLPEEKP